MPATTPNGSRKEKVSTPVETWSEKAPLSRVGMPQPTHDLESALHLPRGVREKLTVLVGDSFYEPSGSGIHQFAEGDEDLCPLGE